MKQRVSAVLIMALFMLALMTSSAAAESSRPATLRERLEVRREERLEKREALKEKVVETRVEKRASLLSNMADRVEDRFARHAARLQSWIDRAAANIAKKKEDGKDVSAAEKALLSARTALADANEQAAKAVTQLRGVTTESWIEQKADAQAAQDAVNAAQKAYAQIVRNFEVVIQELKKLSE